MVARQAVRQWVRVLASDRHAERFLAKATGELETMLNFFVEYPVGRLTVCVRVCMSEWNQGLADKEAGDDAGSYERCC